jgi:hypothetical protein
MALLSLFKRKAKADSGAPKTAATAVAQVHRRLDRARDHVARAKRAISFLPATPYRQALLGSAEKALARDC